MIHCLKHTDAAKPIFGNWQETMIWSCLQQVMGHIYADDLQEPQSAMARLGDFCFFAGQPAKELVMYQPPEDRRDFMIMVPQNEAWGRLIAGCYQDRAKPAVRYAIQKEAGIFDRQKLQAITEGISAEYELHMIGEELYAACRREGWTKDLVAQFPSYAFYQKWGLGVVALRDGRIVSGASSYSAYQGGIEIEIDTHREYRRRGLALACGAKLILSCLERGLYPSWDAQNLGSVALAEKLGYHFDHEYPVFEVYGCSEA